MHLYLYVKAITVWASLTGITAHAGLARGKAYRLGHRSGRPAWLRRGPPGVSARLGACGVHAHGLPRVPLRGTRVPSLRDSVARRISPTHPARWELTWRRSRPCWPSAIY